MLEMLKLSKLTRQNMMTILNRYRLKLVIRFQERTLAMNHTFGIKFKKINFFILKLRCLYRHTFNKQTKEQIDIFILKEINEKFDKYVKVTLNK